MDKINDIIGNKYGRLTVISFDHANGYCKYYLCRCDCGNEKIVTRGNLFAGYTKSCGCYQKEQTSKAKKLPNDYAHLHRILEAMIYRCTDKRNNRYHRYGSRGISVCDEWVNNKDAFCEWSINNGYERGLTIDRIDNDKGYSPENCRWVTPREQLFNYSKNVLIEHNNEKKPIAQWCFELGFPYKRAISRYYNIKNRGIDNPPFEAIFYNSDYRNKPVLQYTKDGTLVKKWDKIKDVSDDGHIVARVSGCCNGRFKTHHGYIWKFDDSFISLSEEILSASS